LLRARDPDLVSVFIFFRNNVEAVVLVVVILSSILISIFDIVVVAESGWLKDETETNLHVYLQLFNDFSFIDSLCLLVLSFLVTGRGNYGWSFFFTFDEF